MAEFKELIRISNADIDGKKPIYHALRKIKGISFMMANAICTSANIEKNKKAGDLSNQEVAKIEDVIKNPKEIPSWLFNRRKDYDDGLDKHLVTTGLNFTKEFDIKRLQKAKTYRGLRHAWGLPVRGKKKRSHFRKGKSVGVIKKTAKMAQAKETKDKGDKK